MLPDSGRVSVTLVTGATGLVGSHVTRLLVERGDHVRVTVRTGSILDQIDGLDIEMARCDILDRQAVRRAMRGVTRVFHVAGLTSLRAGADALYRVNVDGTRIVLEEALRAGVERVVHTSSVAAIGPARARRDGRRAAGLPRRPPRPAVRQQQARGRERGAAGRRARAAGRDRQPRLRPRARRRLPLLDGARAALPAPPDPGLRRRRAERRRRQGRRASATCSPTSAARPASATSSATATSRSTACSPISRASAGSSRRRSSCRFPSRSSSPRPPSACPAGR